MTIANAPNPRTKRLTRIRRTPEQRAELIEAFRASDLTAPKFAALHGLSYQTLLSWLRKEKPEAARPVASPPAITFYPAETAETAENDHSPALGRVDIALPGGCCLGLTSSDQVSLAAALLHALESSRPC